jgi:hypothetical protein
MSRITYKSQLVAATALGFAMLLPLASAEARDKVISGAFTVERPTLVSLGFEWMIEGDDNRNSVVDIFYRKAGVSEWRRGLPMMRMHREFVAGPTPQYGEHNYFNYTAPNGFAGSILDLEPATEYDVRLVLSDPDGITGPTEQTAQVRTRKEPMPAVGGRTFHVYPVDHKGEKQQPAFTGLLHAYYHGADASDHYNALAPRVRPGDTILVHAGLYQDNPLYFGGRYSTQQAPGYGVPFDGTYYLTASGTAEKPIVIKGAGDGEVIFDGNGSHNLFNLLAANHNYFEGITVRNTSVAFLVGWKLIAGSSGFTLKNSLFYDVRRGVQSEFAGSRDIYIADNVFLGRHLPERITSLFGPEIWSKWGDFPAAPRSEYAVKVYGQGHVVTRNYVSNFHDGIDIATYGNPSENPEEQGSSIDIYANDLFNFSDNCIELDGGVHNVRAFDNRCFNASSWGYATQPIFGGPAYIFRNIMYNGPGTGALKLLDNPSGVLVYQNTFIGPAGSLGPLSNVHFRNNLFVADGWPQPLFNVRTFTNYSSSDFNGFGLNPEAKNGFGWNSPAFEVRADYDSRLVARPFATLADYQKATGQDRNSVTVSLADFVKVTPVNPADPRILYVPEAMDFRLRPGSRAVDAGTPLAGINDGFAGRAPDLGAIELGSPAPHYGPRTWPAGAPTTGPRSLVGPPRR